MITAMTEKIDALFADRQSTVSKDLRLNFKRLLEDGGLTAEEATLTVIATAKASNFKALLEAACQAAIAQGIAKEVIQEAEENAAIMSMLNVYYRSRHFIESADPAAKEDYGAARLRMMSLANPAMGKEKFEMLAFAVSAINGCEMCITSHEKALMAIGVSRDRIHELIRLSAVVSGLGRLV